MRGALSSDSGRLTAVVACAALTLVASSCSRAVRMSVVAPADMTAMPAEGHAHGAPIYARADSSTAQDDGLLVPAGDSMMVYDRFDPHAGITRSGAPVRYQFRRIARELDVMGYQPAEGSWRAMEGRVRARGDSFEFVRITTPARGLRRGTPGETLLVASRSLSRLDLQQEDPGRTVATILLVTGVMVASVFAALAASSWGWAAFY
jgi:hypothetical protein